jgi:hypothetical protein
VGDDVVNDVHGARMLGIAAIRVVTPGNFTTPDDDAELVINSLPQLPEAAALLLTLVSAHVA